MRYTKQIYSNNYISNHLRNLFFHFNKNKSQLKYNFNHEIKLWKKLNEKSKFTLEKNTN